MGPRLEPLGLRIAFRVRIVDLANSTSKTFFLDGVSVNVTYR